MSVASDHVAFFRTARADRYVDTVTVTDLTDRGTYNRATKGYDSPSTSVVYTGGALIRPNGGGPTERAETGEIIEELAVQVPYDTDGILVGHVVTVDTATLDGDLTGATLVVQRVEVDTYLTHRVLYCNRSLGGGDRG